MAATDFEFIFNLPKAFTKGLGEVEDNIPPSLCWSLDFGSFSSFASLEAGGENADLGEEGIWGTTCLLAFVRHFLKRLGAENLWKIPSSSEVSVLLSNIMGSSSLSRLFSRLTWDNSELFWLTHGDGLSLDTVSGIDWMGFWIPSSEWALFCECPSGGWYGEDDAADEDNGCCEGDWWGIEGKVLGITGLGGGGCKYGVWWVGGALGGM